MINHTGSGASRDSNGARITTWLDEEHIHGYPDFYVQSRYTHTMVYVANLIKELKYENKNIGVEMDNYWYSAKSMNVLHQELPVPFLKTPRTWSTGLGQ